MKYPVAHYDEIPLIVFGVLLGINNKNSSSALKDSEWQEEVFKHDTPYNFSKIDLSDLVHHLIV